MEYYSAFLLQLNMEPCFSADTPPLSGIHIKQLSPPTFTWHSFRRLSSHLYLAHILSLPFHLYMTLFFIFFYPTFICGFTATSVPTFIWHFFITSHAGICSAEGLFTPTFTCNLYSPSASILFHLNVTLPQGFSAEYLYPP